MKYSDIVPSYEDYVRLQVEKYGSFESQVPAWHDPQREAIEKFFVDIPKDANIIDAACGDGYGISVLDELGYHNVLGFDLSKEKVDIVIAKKLMAIQCDIHVMPVDMEPADVIYSSHTLEHCYRPGVVLDQFYINLKPNGRLFVIVPYPDDGPDDAHGGKYELGTIKQDNLQSTSMFFNNHGFLITQVEVADRGGPEIRMWMSKMTLIESKP